MLPNVSFKSLAIYSNLTGLALLLGVWIYYQHLVDADAPWLTYQNSPFPVLESAVQMGQPVTLNVQRCSVAKNETIYNFASKLVSETDPLAPPITLTTQPESIEPGCLPVTSKKNVIPLNIPPGRYHVHGLSQIPTRYHIFAVPWDSQPFEVVAPPAP